MSSMSSVSPTMHQSPWLLKIDILKCHQQGLNEKVFAIQLYGLSYKYCFELDVEKAQGSTIMPT